MAIDLTGETHLLHPYAPRQSQVAVIEARLELDAANRLRFSYVLTGDLARLRVPPPASPQCADRLWQHTCFEAFIAVGGTSAYYEYNFSPSREWAAFAFRAYRDGDPLHDDHFAPEIRSIRDHGRLEVSASVRWRHLPLIQPGMTLRVGLAAVIEAVDGTLSHWALKHPADRPDFHHADSFVLELALPAESA
jgi:hypothetical protein